MMRIMFLHTVVGTGVQNLRMPWECVCVCVRTHVLKQTIPLLSTSICGMVGYDQASPAACQISAEASTHRRFLEAVQ